jgi:Protein of unknown function (DUF3800)
VYLLFLDESGKPDEAMFALGGVAIRADEWETLRERWDHVQAEHEWPRDKEIKWHGTKTGEVPPALADAVYAELAAAPVTCFVTILRPLAGRQAHPELLGSAEDTYATALTFLAERFQRFLARSDSHGVIVLDSRRREVDDRMRRFFDRLQSEGTTYADLDRIVDSLLLGPSHFSLGLQVADLVVGATLAAQRAPGDASRWFKQLLPRFARHPDTGELEGVGLKTFPPRPKGEEPVLAKLFEPSPEDSR